MSSHKKNLLVRVLYFSFLILPIVLLVGIFKDSFDRLKSMDQLNHHKKNFEHVVHQILHGVVCNSTSELSVEKYAKKELGDFAEFLPIIQNTASLNYQAGLELRETLKTLKGVLALETITNDDEIIHSKAKVQLVLDGLSSFRNRYNLATAQAKLEFEAINCDDKYKTIVLQCFEQAYVNSTRNYEEFIRIEEAIALQIDRVLNFLSERKGALWELDGRLIFERGSEAQQCNLFVQKLQELSLEEEKIVNHLIQETKDFQQKVKAPLNQER